MVQGWQRVNLCHPLGYPSPAPAPENAMPQVTSRFNARAASMPRRLVAMGLLAGLSIGAGIALARAQA